MLELGTVSAEPEPCVDPRCLTSFSNSIFTTLRTSGKGLPHVSQESLFTERKARSVPQFVLHLSTMTMPPMKRNDVRPSRRSDAFAKRLPDANSQQKSGQTRRATHAYMNLQVPLCTTVDGKPPRSVRLPCVQLRSRSTYDPQRTPDDPTKGDRLSMDFTSAARSSSPRKSKRHARGKKKVRAARGPLLVHKGKMTNWGPNCHYGGTSAPSMYRHASSATVTGGGTIPVAQLHHWLFSTKPTQDPKRNTFFRPSYTPQKAVLLFFPSSF